jgi:hypothetical protein
MQSFQAFDLYDYLILSGIAIVAIIVFILSFRKINRDGLEKKTFSRRNALIRILIGTLFMITAISAYILVEKSHTGLFAFVSIMTCRPYVLLSITGFLTGLLLVLLNFHKIQAHSKAK